MARACTFACACACDDAGDVTRMRIHAFFQHMPPYPGAAALRGHAIVSGLVALRESAGLSDIRVYSTTPQPGALPGATVVALDVPEVENARSLPARVIGELRIGLVAARTMLAGERCDLAIISMPGYIAALVIAARARLLGIPYVLELRDIYPQVYAEAGLLSRNSLLYRFFSSRSRVLYEKARMVIAATQGLAREAQLNAPDAVVHCVYNGFPARLGERQAQKHDRFTACFHGTLGFFQDVDTLLAVSRKLEPHDIDVVAIGYGRGEEALRTSAPGNLRFLGRLSFADTISQVEQCHVGLCLRRDDEISKDAFPVKVWEYLGLGIPSIVTPPCEAGQFLGQHGCGMQFPSGAVEEIVAAVLQLRDRPDELGAMERRCRAVAAGYTRERLGLQAAELIAAPATAD